MSWGVLVLGLGFGAWRDGGVISGGFLFCGFVVGLGVGRGFWGGGGCPTLGCGLGNFGCFGLWGGGGGGLGWVWGGFGVFLGGAVSLKECRPLAFPPSLGLNHCTPPPPSLKVIKCLTLNLSSRD